VKQVYPERLDPVAYEEEMVNREFLDYLVVGA